MYYDQVLELCIWTKQTTHDCFMQTLEIYGGTSRENELEFALCWTLSPWGYGHGSRSCHWIHYIFRCLGQLASQCLAALVVSNKTPCQ